MRQRLVPARIVSLAVAVVVAAVLATVYRTRVFSRFDPIRIEAVKAKIDAAGQVVAIALPDLSNVRGQPAELGLELQNTLLVPRRVAVLREGLSAAPIVLPPSGTVQWDIPLPVDAVHALAGEAGDTARRLEFTGDGGGWAITRVEVRNYHARIGDAPILVVVAEEAAHLPAAGFLLIATALCVLAIASALEPAPARKRLRSIGRGVAAAAFLACLFCLLSPFVSQYKLLLSQSAFLLIAAGLYGPALVQVGIRSASGASTLLRRSGALDALTRAMTIVAGYWSRHEVTFERAAALFGLSAIALAQPIFEVISNSPEFFAARGTSAATAIAGVLVICFGVPAVLLGIERAVRAARPRAATVFFSLTLALLSAAALMPLIHRMDGVAPPWDGVAGSAGGIAVASAARSRFVRQFLTALAPAALIVPALFVFDPEIRQNFLPSGSAAGVQTVARTPPIVFVIFDELPLISLLDADGNIDSKNYPNLAALAGDAYWFRNASTVASNTAHAVPAMLSGRYPLAVNDAPTLRYYPVNLFTTLARHYQMYASLRFQQMCPPRVCQDNSAMAGDTLDALLSDLGLVWLHIVLPRALADTLPPVTEDWAEFGPPRETRTGAGGYGRGGVFREFLSAIDARPARLHFIHSMVPHMPFEYVRSGRRYRRPENELDVFRRNRMFEGHSAAYADAVHQRHLAQAGFVDRLVGDLVSRLRDVGAYEKALIIITSDHGASYREGRPRRQPQEHRNLSDILSVPLLVRVPGQPRGEVVDRIVETVDILPTIFDVIGAKATIRFDGRSMLDVSRPARTARKFAWRNRLNVDLRSFGDFSRERADSLQRRARRFAPGDPIGLYAPPDARHLLGQNAGSAPIRAAQDVAVTIHNARLFDAVNVDRDPLPLYVSGVLETARPEPLTVAVMVNGIVAAVTRSYRERDGHVFSTLIPESSLRNGQNAVSAVVIDAPSP